MLFEIDKFLLGKVFQPLSERIQDWTGLTCFRVARILNLCTFITLLCLCIFLVVVLPFIAFKIMISSAFLIAYGLPLLVNLLMAKKYEAICKSMAQHGNPAVIEFLMYRKKCVVIFILIFLGNFIPNTGILMATISVYHFFDLLFMYFLSCTPKPPRKSKVKKLVESVVEKMKEVFDPVPEPGAVPV